MALPADVVAHLRENLQLISRHQLVVVMGYTPGQVHGWLRRGLLKRHLRGVYGSPCMPERLDRSVLARVLRVGADATAGPRASLAVMGIEGFTDTAPRDVTVTDDRISAFADLHRVDALDPIDRMLHAGVPVMSVARALIELAPVLALKVLRAAIDDGRRKDLVSVEHLRRRAGALCSLPGAAIILGLLDEGQLDMESEGERDMASLLAEALPDEAIEWQVEDLVRGRRFDACVRRLQLAFERDGRDFHIDREPDYIRDLGSAARGVMTVRVSDAMIHADRTRTISDIRDLAGERRRLLGLDD